VKTTKYPTRISVPRSHCCRRDTFFNDSPDSPNHLLEVLYFPLTYLSRLSLLFALHWPFPFIASSVAHDRRAVGPISDSPLPPRLTPCHHRPEGHATSIPSLTSLVKPAPTSLSPLSTRGIPALFSSRIPHGPSYFPPRRKDRRSRPPFGQRVHKRLRFFRQGARCRRR